MNRLNETDSFSFYTPLPYSQEEAEQFLQGKDPFTYLFRSEKTHEYYLSFVNERDTIEHKRFTFNPKEKLWNYRNGTLENPENHDFRDLHSLILKMMRVGNNCQPQAPKWIQPLS